MTQRVPILSADSIEALAADHQRLAAEVRNMAWRLRAYLQAFDDQEVALKEWGRATFDADFNESDGSVAGTLTHQYGTGKDHEDTDIMLINLETDTAGLFVFRGNEDGACWCRYTGFENHWILVIPQCPA